MTRTRTEMTSAAHTQFQGLPTSHHERRVKVCKGNATVSLATE